MASVSYDSESASITPIKEQKEDPVNEETSLHEIAMRKTQQQSQVDLHKIF